MSGSAARLAGLARHGSKWPIKEPTSKQREDRLPIAAAHSLQKQVCSVVNDFHSRAMDVRDSTDLSPKGKAKQYGRLAASLEEKSKEWSAKLQSLRNQAKDAERGLQTKIGTTISEWSPFKQALAHQHYAALASASPELRRAMVQDAIDRRDQALLAAAAHLPVQMTSEETASREIASMAEASLLGMIAPEALENSKQLRFAVCSLDDDLQAVQLGLLAMGTAHTGEGEALAPAEHSDPVDRLGAARNLPPGAAEESSKVYRIAGASPGERLASAFLEESRKRQEPEPAAGCAGSEGG